MPHSQKKHVQLIDKIDIPAGVILNLWDLNKNSRISVEIERPKSDYVIGEVFIMDGRRNKKRVELTPSTEKVDAKSLLIPRKKSRTILGGKGSVSKRVEKTRIYKQGGLKVDDVTYTIQNLRAFRLNKVWSGALLDAAKGAGGVAKRATASVQKVRAIAASKLSKVGKHRTRPGAHAHGSTKKPTHSGRGLK
jgi:hypothetical protein